MRRTALFLCLVSLLASAAVAAEMTPNLLRRANSLCAKASKSFKENDISKASEQFEEALKLVPDMPDAHVGLGNIAMKQKDYEGALRRYNAAKESIGRFTELLKSKEFEAMRDGQHESDVLNDMIQQSKTPSVAGKMSEAQARNLEVTLPNAKADADRVATKRPAISPDQKVPAQLYFLAGNAAFRLNRRDEALQNWENCIRVDPDFAPVYNNLAVLYFLMSRLDDAAASVATAERLGVTVSPQFKQDLAKAQAARTGAGR
jgi:tetratricopeptide (TPR) repeat protein